MRHWTLFGSLCFYLLVLRGSVASDAEETETSFECYTDKSGLNKTSCDSGTLSCKVNKGLGSADYIYGCGDLRDRTDCSDASGGQVCYCNTTLCNTVEWSGESGASPSRSLDLVSWTIVLIIGLSWQNYYFNC